VSRRRCLRCRFYRDAWWNYAIVVAAIASVPTAVITGMPLAAVGW
jgi:hypothetical protein